MKKPLILLDWGACIDRQFNTQGMMMHKAYDWAVAANGGLPVVPMDQNCIKEYVEMGDGLLLPGGMNYAPENGWASYMDEVGHARKECFETELYQAFKKTGKPILAICDGYQKVNCEEGGTLHLNLGQRYGTTHFLTAHKVNTTENSFIREVWGDDFYINSYHVYFVDKLGKDLVITARSPEGVPEALEHVSLPIYGFQFHPERMRGDNCFPAEGVDGNLVFRKFIELCARVRDERGRNQGA